MIYMFAALQRFAEQRGDGLLPELADRLRKTPHRGDGHRITIDGDASDLTIGARKTIDKSKKCRKQKRA
jgi:hypothetical protein